MGNARYNAHGLKTEETDAAGTANQISTEYAYNSADDLTSETDPMGNVTTYTYDLLDDLLSETDPGRAKGDILLIKVECPLYLSTAHPRIFPAGTELLAGFCS